MLFRMSGVDVIPSLFHLNLANNLLRDVDPVLSRCTYLSYLDVSMNRIGNVSLFPRLGHLTVLLLNDNEVRGMLMHHTCCFSFIMNLPFLVSAHFFRWSAKSNESPRVAGSAKPNCIQVTNDLNKTLTEFDFQDMNEYIDVVFTLDGLDSSCDHVAPARVGRDRQQDRLHVPHNRSAQRPATSPQSLPHCKQFRSRSRTGYVELQNFNYMHFLCL